MRGGESLLETVQGLLERTYAIPPLQCDIGSFVIGDLGYRRHYAPPTPPADRVRSGTDGAKTLVRESGGAVRLSVYYPDALIRRLEAHPPWRGLREANVDAFAVLVEELDHLLCIADRAREGRSVTLFELELHANVSKHLVLARFLAGRRGRLDDRRRVWLRHHLFGKGSYAAEPPEERRRYRDAARWAVRFLDALERRPHGARIRDLRRFHAASANGKVELIGRLVA